MKFIFMLLAISVATSFAAEPNKTSSEMTFDEVEALLKKTEEERGVTQKTKLDEMQKSLTKALIHETSTRNAYKEAYAGVMFEGGNRDHVKFKDWADKNHDYLNDDCFVWVLRAHMQYILATIEKKRGNDEEALKLLRSWLDLFPKNNDDYNKFRKFDPFPEKGVSTTKIIMNAVGRSGIERYKNFTKHDLFVQGLNGSVFLKSEEATFMIDGLDHWYLGDLGNFPEVHRVNVIAYYRSKKDPKIFEEWEKNLKYEQHVFEREGLELKKNDFANQRKPALVLQMAKDYVAFEKPHEAVKVLLDVLKESPNCKEYGNIVAEIRRIISESKK
jgi:hypothetical protein